MTTFPLHVRNRREKELCTVQISTTTTLSELKQLYKKSNTTYKIDINRQYYTIGNDKTRKTIPNDVPIVNLLKSSDNAALIDTVYIKDLGPQISWKTVFHVEYFGPILIHALYYFLPSLFYSLPSGMKEYPEKNLTQQVAFWLVIFHYLKREYETHAVHRFSLETMPLINIFKNSTHYWIFGGAMIAYFLYHPLFTEVYSHTFVIICGVAMFLCELGNYYCHIILRDLRPPGTRTRGVPRGFLFEYTTCANYTCEVFAWFFFALFTHCLTSYFFLIVSTLQIAQWSVKKHVALKKEFGKDVPRRKILFPFIW